MTLVHNTVTTTPQAFPNLATSWQGVFLGEGEGGVTEFDTTGNACVRTCERAALRQRRCSEARSLREDEEEGRDCIPPTPLNPTARPSSSETQSGIVVGRACVRALVASLKNAPRGRGAQRLSRGHRRRGMQDRDRGMQDRRSGETSAIVTHRQRPGEGGQGMHARWVGFLPSLPDGRQLQQRGT